MHGFGAHIIDKGRRLRFWLIDHRPPLDASTGKPLLDTTKVGDNSTLDVYDLDLHHGTQLAHVRMIVSETIISSNNLVIIQDNGDKGGFLFSNVHSIKFNPSCDRGYVEASTIVVLIQASDISPPPKTSLPKLHHK
jgi:hypothetical protein